MTDGDDLLARYLRRVGLDGADPADLTVAALHRAHVQNIPYENLTVRLGQTVHLGPGELAAKMVDRRRGGYCYEQNSLFASVLEAAGFAVTRCLGRVRMMDPVSPRPATHMVLLVDGHAVDVGFGSANPLGPIPLGGEATYGPYTWSTRRTETPEGEEAWLVSLYEMPLYTFTEAPHHPVDYVAPNHFSATHPMSLFVNHTIVQRWAEDGRQIGLVDLDLTIRNPDHTTDVTRIDAADLGAVLRDEFGLDLDDEEVARLAALTPTG